MEKKKDEQWLWKGFYQENSYQRKSCIIKIFQIYCRISFPQLLKFNLSGDCAKWLQSHWICMCVWHPSVWRDPGSTPQCELHFQCKWSLAMSSHLSMAFCRCSWSKDEVTSSPLDGGQFLVQNNLQNPLIQHTVYM